VETLGNWRRGRCGRLSWQVEGGGADVIGMHAGTGDKGAGIYRVGNAVAL